MGESGGSAVCGMCAGDLPIGGEPPRRIGHAVHKKCEDRFVFQRGLAWVPDSVQWFMLGGMLLGVVFVNGLTKAELEKSNPGLWIRLALMLGFLFKDSIRGLSPRKLLLGLQVVGVRTVQPIGPLQSLQRNLIALIPSMPIVLASQMRGGQRWGGGWAQTRVIQHARAHRPASGGVAPSAELDWSSQARGS